MRKQPDLILQFAHFLQDDFQQKGHRHVVVRVDSRVLLNGRPSQPMIDLGNVAYAYFRKNTWSLPLHEGNVPAAVSQPRGANVPIHGQ